MTHPPSIAPICTVWAAQLVLVVTDLLSLSWPGSRSGLECVVKGSDMSACGPQVSAFLCMLRVAKRPRMEVLQVDPQLLQPLLHQYQEALAALRQNVMH